MFQGDCTHVNDMKYGIVLRSARSARRRIAGTSSREGRCSEIEARRSASGKRNAGKRQSARFERRHSSTSSPKHSGI